MGGERKGMGEPGHDAGNCGHLSNFSQDVLEWGLGQLNGAMGQSRVIPAPLGAPLQGQEHPALCTRTRQDREKSTKQPFLPEKNTLLLQRAAKEKESMDSADRSRNHGSLQNLIQGPQRHSQDFLSQGSCSARGPGAALPAAAQGLGIFIPYKAPAGTSYLVLEESMSSTSFAKCFLCFWMFGISTCSNTGSGRR